MPRRVSIGDPAGDELLSRARRLVLSASALGITQRMIAEKAGVSQALVGRIVTPLKGSRPSRKFAEDVATACEGATEATAKAWRKRYLAEHPHKPNIRSRGYLERLCEEYTIEERWQALLYAVLTIGCANDVTGPWHRSEGRRKPSHA